MTSLTISMPSYSSIKAKENKVKAAEDGAEGLKCVGAEKL